MASDPVLRQRCSVQGLRIRSIFGRIRQSDFYHPDPDPTFTNLELILRYHIFHINQISSDIFMLIFLSEKMEKFALKFEVTPFF